MSRGKKHRKSLFLIQHSFLFLETILLPCCIDEQLTSWLCTDIQCNLTWDKQHFGKHGWQWTLCHT